MNKKFLALLPVFLLTSCGTQGAPSSKEYSYVNPEEPQGDYGPVVEAGVNLDGLGNESFYETTSYRIYNSAGEESYADVKFGFADKGLLAYAYVHEKEIYENPSVVIYHQDSFELYINPGVYKDELRSNCVQFRMSPHLRQETWIGLKSHVSDYTWTYYYVPFRYASHVDGKVITTEAERDDPSFLNSQGVGYEFYIPYTSLGLDYNPHGLDILPAMVTAHSMFDDDHVWSSYNNVDIDDLKNYITVGNRTYKDQGNNVFNTDLTSSGFLLDHQLDNGYPYVKNFGIHDQYAYFNAYSNVYYAKARITLYRPLENDAYPKVGIGSINSDGTSVMLLDPRPNNDNFQALLVDRAAGQDWRWGEAPIDWKGEHTYANPILFEVARLENEIYYYMNGQIIFTGNASFLGNKASYPMIMTMNYSALFDQCVVSTDRNVVEDRIGEVDPYLDHTLSTAGYTYLNGVISQNGTHDQYGIFKVKGTNYTLSADIVLGSNLNGDLYPKIGVGEISSTKIQAYLFDPRPNKDCFEMVHVSGNAVGDNAWEWQEIFWAGEQSYDRVMHVKLVRDGATSYIYLDNILAFTLNNNGFGNEDTHPMFFTMNHSGTFSNIQISVND